MDRRNRVFLAIIGAAMVAIPGAADRRKFYTRVCDSFDEYGPTDFDCTDYTGIDEEYDEAVADRPIRRVPRDMSPDPIDVERAEGEGMTIPEIIEPPVYKRTKAERKADAKGDTRPFSPEEQKAVAARLEAGLSAYGEEPPPALASAGGAS